MTILTVPGLVVLALRRRWDLSLFCSAACGMQVLLIAGYPEWTGGWATGPRLLLPMLPFAFIPVAAVLADGGKAVSILATGLALVGVVLNFLCQSVGGRIPETISEPVSAAILPLWRGKIVPGWPPRNPFDRTVAGYVFPDRFQTAHGSSAWIQFLPLIGFLAVATILILSLPTRFWTRKT